MPPPPRALWHMLRALAKTSFGRLRTRSSQPFKYDVLLDLMRRNNAHLVGLEPEGKRAFLDRLAMAYDLPAARERTRLSGVDVEWFRLEEPAEGLLIYLHGGAYVMGSTETYADLIGRLAIASGRDALGVNYRLAPEHQIEDAVEDVISVYEAVLAIGTPPSKIIFAGDSAGGALVFSSLIRLREQGRPMPGGAVGLSPWVDMRAERPSYFENEATDWSTREQLMQYIDLVCGDESLSEWPRSTIDCNLSKLPRTLLHAGGGELLRDDVIAFAEQLNLYAVEARLVVWTGMCHNFHAFAGLLPLAQEAVEDIGAFVQEVCTTPSQFQETTGESSA